MGTVSGAGALVLAAVLLVAGVGKVRRPRAFAWAVHRLLPEHLPYRRRLALTAAPTVGALEVVLGAGLLGFPRWAVPVASSTCCLFAGFCVVVGAAVRKQTSCGCFAASAGVATRADLIRTVALALVAAGLLAVVLTGRAGAPRSPGAAVLALGLGLAALVARVATTGGGARPTARPLPPAPRPVRGGERADVLRHLEAAPSVLALRRRLGPRAAELGLRRSMITSAVGTGPIRWLVVTPPRRAGLRVRMSLPWDGRDAADVVISAVVHGRPLLVAGGDVRDATPTIGSIH